MRKYALCLIMALMIAFSAHVYAGSSPQTTNLAVTASVAQVGYTVAQTTAVAFGEYSSATAKDATGVITIASDAAQTTTAHALRVKLNAGTTTGATITQRLLKHATLATTLNYNLFKTTSDRNLNSNPWGESADADLDVGTGVTLPLALDIYARIPAGQTGKDAGNYADTVTVTVEW